MRIFIEVFLLSTLVVCIVYFGVDVILQQRSDYNNLIIRRFRAAIRRRLT